MSVQWAWCFENTTEYSMPRWQENPQFQKIALVKEIAAARVTDNAI